MEAKEILEIAFKEARKAASKKTSHAKGEQKFIELDMIRIETSYAVTAGYLNAYIKEASAELSEFEKALMETMIDISEKNREIESIKATIQILKRLKNEISLKTKYSKNRVESGAMRKQYYGRMNSLVKRLRFEAIESFAKEINSLPKLKKIDTIIIAGYPNVGKSQILKIMSGKRIETAPYPFTTKELLVGFAKNRYADVQMIDTPGVLDRPIEKRNEIEKKALIALKYISKNVLFVIDPSETCGYTLEAQLALKREIERDFKPKMFVVATKKDIVAADVEADAYVNATDANDVEGLRAKIMKFFF
jgi:nucleolar GTP-binding protein